MYVYYILEVRVVSEGWDGFSKQGKQSLLSSSSYTELVSVKAEIKDFYPNMAIELAEYPGIIIRFLLIRDHRVWFINS